MNQFERSILLLGQPAVNKLNASSVVIFGLGGVGGQLTEALARAGIGKFMLIDHDIVSTSNINRQIIATHKTVGQQKTEVMSQRILDINPKAKVESSQLFITKENISEISFTGFDYVADAIDAVSAKIAIIQQAKESAVPIITSMGAGNRLSANFIAADIHATYGCPLAKKVRQELKKIGISGVKAVFSPDAPIKNGEKTIGSVSFVPPAAGLFMAGEIIKDLIGL